MSRFILVSVTLIIIAFVATVFVWYLVQSSYKEAEKATFIETESVTPIKTSE